MKAVWAFISVVIIAIGIFSLALYIDLGAPLGPDWMPANLTIPLPGYVGWCVGAAIIFLAAISLRSGGLELTVASEFMVVYGIFGLLFNLASGVVIAVPEIDANSAELKLAVLAPVMERFAEGLLSAGTAPVFAVILRLFDSSTSHKRGGAGDDAAAAYKALKEAADAARLSIATSGNEFKTSIDKVSAAANGLTAALQGSGSGVSGELEKALEALRRVNGELGGLTTHSREAGANVGELARRAHNAKLMLQALGDTIEKVSNFVRAM